MLFFLLLLGAPALFAAAVLTDKFLVHDGEEDSDPGALMSVGSIFSFGMAGILVVWIMCSTVEAVNLWSLIPLALNGFTYVLGMGFYLYALKSEESSRVDPWFQTVPVFGLVGGSFFLNEILGLGVVVSIGLLVVGGFILSIKKGRMNKKVVCLMLSASALLAINDIVFAQFGRGLDWKVAICADEFGKGLWALSFLIHPSVRKGFAIGIKTKLKLQAGTNIMAMVADAILDAGKLYVPIALVQAICALQPAFVLLGAFLLTKFFPKFLSEEFAKDAVVQKVLGVSTVIAGGILLTYVTLG